MKINFSVFIKLIFLGTMVLFSAFPAYSQDIYFPYNRIYLELPALEDPYPGLGSNYSCLGKGMGTALWNPAGLSKIGTMEQTISLLQTAATGSFVNTINMNDISQSIGTSNEATLLVLFTSNQTETSATSREIGITTYTNSYGMPISVSQAMKVADWLHLGFMTKGNFSVGLGSAGNAPALIKSQMDFANVSMGTGFSISSGKLSYTDGGTTFETSQALWDGFLSQNATLPATAYTNLDNNLKVENNFIITAAANHGPVAVGFNFIPISASSQINNTAKVVLSSTATDFLIYTPDLDSSNPADVIKWVQDPDLYGGEQGYKSNTITIPTGKAIADAAFQGNYSGSTIRTDIGTTIDLGTDVVFSAAIENFGSASLKMTGSGITSYVVHRVNTNETTPTFDLTQDFTWSPFFDSPTQYTGFNYTLASEQTYNLPRRIRYGFLFKKPFLIAIDYEQQTNPYQLKSTDSSGNSVTTNFNKINLLRIGFESQLFGLPAWIQSGTALLFKPEATGANAASYQQQIDSAFNSLGLGMLPVRVDLGLSLKAWDTLAGLSFGINAMSLLDMVQLDTINPDVGKIAFFSLYADRDPWRITWGMSLDEIATASAIGTKISTTSDLSYNFAMTDLKWRTTYMLSYKF